MSNELTGTVKFFSDEKGFGFISCTSLSKDVFVHALNIRAGSLSSNQQVKFKVREGNKGKEAYDVMAI
ncbi:cold-shock protein [Pseudofrancisella aestuarii]|uniref:Cold-shock protein n=1 Tax=Pseudofrancisella aestuarii TaxID=2670347 RepID=A0ABV9TDF8_9GAMM|nr:cold shock domain-containing protein [Pseudofrancisella aestuarii]